MAERVVASVRAVLTRTLWLTCPHCRRESELELPQLDAILAEAQDPGRAEMYQLGQRQWEVFRVLRDASPKWVAGRTLYQVIWQGMGARQSTTSALREIERKIGGTPWRLERRGGAGGTAAFYRVVPADA